MQTCQRCGAGLDDSIVKCPYCGTETPRAPVIAAAAWQAQARTQVAVAQQVQRVGADVSKASVQALILSLLGFFICCPPLALWALVAALRARSRARITGMPVPGTTVVAFVFIALHTLAVLGFSVWFAFDMHAHSERLGELKTIVDARSAEPTLSQPIACALAEQRLLEDGYAGTGGLNIENFRCDGRVSQSGDRAEIDQIRFRPSAGTVVSARACFSRGARWSVQSITTGTCGDAHP